MDSSQIYEYAEKQGWLLIHEGDYTHVYEKSLPVAEGADAKHANRKYVYVSLTSHGEYHYDDTRLVIPHQGIIRAIDEDDDAKLLTWWLDGNEGSDDDWFNQLSKEEQEALT